MSNVNVKSIFAGVYKEVNAARENEAGLIEALRGMPGTVSNVQWYLNAYSIQNCGSLKTISGFLKARTNLNLSYAVTDTKVNANGHKAKATDAGAMSLRTYIEQALAEVEGDDEESIAIRNLSTNVQHSTLYVVSGFSPRPKQSDKLSGDKLEARQAEWDSKKQFLADFLAGNDITIKGVCEEWAAGEQQLDDNGKPKMVDIVIAGSVHQSSISKFEASVAYQTRKAKAENKPETKTAEQKAEAALKRAVEILKGIDFTLIVNSADASLKDVIKAAAVGLKVQADDGAQAQESVEHQLEASKEAMQEAARTLDIAPEAVGQFFVSEYHDFYTEAGQFIGPMTEWLDSLTNPAK